MNLITMDGTVYRFSIHNKDRASAVYIYVGSELVAIVCVMHKAQRACYDLPEKSGIDVDYETWAKEPIEDFATWVVDQIK